jgi:hypothetical protein
MNGTPNPAATTQAASVQEVIGISLETGASSSVETNQSPTHPSIVVERSPDDTHIITAPDL